jgi:type II secretory pathway pseudopilin PulG
LGAYEKRRSRVDTTFVFGFPLKREIEIGHLLTFLTLAAGLLWWLFKTIRDWRHVSRLESNAGALRLLLRLLRRRGGQPVSMEALRTEFNAPTLKQARKIHCRRDYRFKTEEAFEAAINILDSEGKIDFFGGNEVAFRVDRSPQSEPMPERVYRATPEDGRDLLRVLQEALEDSKADAWQLRQTARAALALQPESTESALRTALKHTDPLVQRKAAEVLAGLVVR